MCEYMCVCVCVCVWRDRCSCVIVTAAVLLLVSPPQSVGIFHEWISAACRGLLVIDSGARAHAAVFITASEWLSPRRS